MKIRFYFLIVGLISTTFLNAQKLTLNEIFNNGAVLQQKSKVQIWGTSTPGNTVTVKIQGKNFQTKSDATGNWTDELNSLKAGGPFLMEVISAKDTLKLNEIYVGEVWLAGGQSNMGFMLENSDSGKTEIANAKNKNIRFVMVPYKPYNEYKAKGDMNWRTATTENVSEISAVAYYFAKELQAKLQVPVGVICCYKGGSGAETWMSREGLLKSPETSPIVEKYDKYMADLGNDKYMQLIDNYDKAVKQYRDSIKSGFKANNPKEPMGFRNYNRPYGLYENMLKRVIPYTIKGAIWYQGEHNSSRAKQYQTLFPMMINEWREEFKNPDMPFLFAQLPGYANADTRNRAIWPEQREAQLLTWQKLAHTGMAVTNDVGEKETIHPPHKEPVGKRLALIAFNQAYGFDIPFMGPVYKSVKFEGNKAILSFDYIYKGLKSNGELNGFTICGEDKKFVSAKAEIINNQIVVFSEGINAPVAVRYDWANWTVGNLKNSADLQASPFRTDNFPLITEGNKTDKY